VEICSAGLHCSRALPRDAALLRVSKAASVTFTIEQINDLHARLVSARTLRSMCWRLRGSASNGTIPTWPTAIRNTSAEGVTRSSPPPLHEVLSVAEIGEREMFLEHLRRHERRETTYVEMSTGLAQSGIEKWTIDTVKMTMTFYDKAGRTRRIIDRHPSRRVFESEPGSNPSHIGVRFPR